MGLRVGAEVRDHAVVGPLLAVDYRGAPRDATAEGRADPPRRRLPVPADDGQAPLAGVDRHGDAEQPLGEAAPPCLAVAVGEVGVDDVGLVDPDPVPEDGSVLVAVDGGEDPVPPLPGRLVGDADRLGDAVDGHVVAHEPDEGGPLREAVAGVLEDRPGQRVALASACGALPPLDPRRGAPVAPRAIGRARGAGGVRPELVGRLGEGREAKPLAAPALGDGLLDEVDLVRRGLDDAGAEGVLPYHVITTIPLRPGDHPTEPSPNREPGGLQGMFSIWHGESYHLGPIRPISQPSLSRLLELH